MPEIKKYLSKDGLEDYNELLPHSATQVQEYVNDWLDEHPEATTTVEDNSITTVKLRDGCVTTPKLADESVTPNKISQDLYQLIVGNVLRGNASGNIVSVNDAFATFPLEVAVDGKSTQNGTPTPDAPVEIRSVDDLALEVHGKNLYDGGDQTFTQYKPLVVLLPAGTYTVSALVTSSDTDTQTCSFLFRYADGSYSTLMQIGRDTRSHNTITLVNPVNSLRLYAAASSNSGIGDTATWKDIQIEAGSTATAYTPYVEPTTVPDLLPEGTELRSLPDGTKDTLALTYLRPSTREGWAWYSRELVQKVGQYNGINSLNWIYSDTSLKFLATDNRVRNDGASESTRMSYVLCSKYKAVTHKQAYEGSVNESIGTAYYNRNNHILITDRAYDGDSLAAFKQSLVDAVFLYPLATPTIETLDPIELPVLPAPTCTVWADPSTGITLSYERDLTIAINAIEQAMADL